MHATRCDIFSAELVEMNLIAYVLQGKSIIFIYLSSLGH